MRLLKKRAPRVLIGALTFLIILLSLAYYLQSGVEERRYQYLSDRLRLTLGEEIEQEKRTLLSLAVAISGSGSLIATTRQEGPLSASRMAEKILDRLQLYAAYPGVEIRVVPSVDGDLGYGVGRKLAPVPHFEASVPLHEEGEIVGKLEMARSLIPLIETLESRQIGLLVLLPSRESPEVGPFAIGQERYNRKMAEMAQTIDFRQLAETTYAVRGGYFFAFEPFDDAMENGGYLLAIERERIGLLTGNGDLSFFLHFSQGDMVKIAESWGEMGTPTARSEVLLPPGMRGMARDELRRRLLELPKEELVELLLGQRQDENRRGVIQ